MRSVDEGEKRFLHELAVLFGKSTLVRRQMTAPPLDPLVNEVATTA